MSNYADILAELSEATPVFRRYARALGAGVGLVVADGDKFGRFFGVSKINCN